MKPSSTVIALGVDDPKASLVEKEIATTANRSASHAACIVTAEPSGATRWRFDR